MSQLTGAFGLFQPSMEAFKRNIGAFLALYILPYALLMAGVFVFTSMMMKNNNLEPYGTNAGPSDIAVGPIVLLALLIYGAFIYLAMASVVLQVRAAQGGKNLSPLAILGETKRFFWRLLGLSIAVAVVVSLGFLFLIVPGIIFLHWYFYAIFILVAEDCSMGEAFNRSKALVKGHTLAAWGVIGVMFVLGLTGIIPLIGWLISLVLGLFYVCAPALRYVELKKISGTAAPLTPAAAAPVAPVA